MDDDLSLVVLADAKDRMEKAVSHTQTDFGGVRTGRATSGLVEHMRVDIYGA
jgi:ribosome recycling factor